MQQSRPYLRHEDDRCSVHHYGDEQDGQYEEPEPDEYVRLLVDNVQRQKAKGVVLLYRAGGTVLVEDTLGDAREHVDHRVDSLLLRRVRDLQHSQTVAEEFTVEESIHQVQLTEYVDEAQDLASEVPIHVRVVILKVQFIN